jgi:prevent-host-death family protein
MTHTLPITKAREDLTKLVNNASKRLDEYVITVNGSPAAVLISAAEYESWKETNEIMSDPQLMKDIAEGEKDIAAGRVYNWEDVKKELGFDDEDHVQNKTNKKSKKRA